MVMFLFHAELKGLMCLAAKGIVTRLIGVEPLKGCNPDQKLELQMNRI